MLALNQPAPLPGTASETAEIIRNQGGEALAIPCDVGNEEQVKAMVQQVVDRYGRIDVLVNNAGIMILGEKFLDIDTARWDNIMEVNVRGAYLTCRYVLPVMMEQRRGSIINIGSLAGTGPRFNGAAYCCSKAALHMLSQCLAEDMREYNIAVNILDPGPYEKRGFIHHPVGAARLARSGRAGGGGSMRRIPGPARRPIAYRAACIASRVRQDLGNCVTATP